MTSYGKYAIYHMKKDKQKLCLFLYKWYGLAVLKFTITHLNLTINYIKIKVK